MAGGAKVIGDALRGIVNLFVRKPLRDPEIPVPLPTRPRVVPRPVPRTDPPPAPRPPPEQQPRLPRGPRVPDLRDDPETAPDPAPDADPAPETEGQTSTTTEEMQDCETCPDCEPRKQGHTIFRTLTGTDASKLSGAQYQNWVIPWFQWRGETIEEWAFSGTRFDGIDPAICQLIEAKVKYGFMFRDPQGYRPQPHEWARVGPLKKDQEEFETQYYKVVPHAPDATLHWVMHTWAYNLFMFEYIEGFGSLATTEHRPYHEWNEYD